MGAIDSKEKKRSSYDIEQPQGSGTEYQNDCRVAVSTNDQAYNDDSSHNKFHLQSGSGDSLDNQETEEKHEDSVGIKNSDGEGGLPSGPEGKVNTVAVSSDSVHPVKTNQDDNLDNSQIRNTNEGIIVSQGEKSKSLTNRERIENTNVADDNSMLSSTIILGNDCGQDKAVSENLPNGFDHQSKGTVEKMENAVSADDSTASTLRMELEDDFDKAKEEKTDLAENPSHKCEHLLTDEEKESSVASANESSLLHKCESDGSLEDKSKQQSKDQAIEKATDAYDLETEETVTGNGGAVKDIVLSVAENIGPKAEYKQKFVDQVTDEDTVEKSVEKEPSTSPAGHGAGHSVDPYTSEHDKVRKIVENCWREIDGSHGAGHSVDPYTSEHDKVRKIVENCWREIDDSHGAGHSVDPYTSEHDKVRKIVENCWREIDDSLENFQTKFSRQTRRGWKVVRLFVSSTFTDFYAEREITVKKV